MKQNLSISIIFVFILYFFTANLGLYLQTFSNTSPIWPASGVAVACLYLLGLRVWPSILAASFLANYLVPTEVLSSLTIAIGNTLEAVLGYFLIRKILYTRQIPRIQRIPLAFILTAALPALVSATIGTLTITLSEKIAISQSFDAWIIWWSGVALGILAIVPLVLKTEQNLKFNQNKILSAFTLISATLLTYLVFSSQELYWTFCFFPFLILVGYLVGNIELKVSTIIICTVSLILTFNGKGPFSLGNFAHEIISLQIFLASILVFSLSVGNVKSYTPLRIPALILMFCLCITFLLAYSFKKSITKEESHNSSKEVSRIHEQLQESILLYDNLLTAGVGYLQSSDDIGPKDWASFLNPFKFLERFPGILGLGVALRTPLKESMEFIKLNKLEGGIRPLLTNGKSSDPAYVITLVEPHKYLSMHRGIDLGSEPIRRQAIESAYLTGQSTSTGRIKLQNYPEFSEGFLLIKYFEGYSKKNNLSGFVYAPIIYKNFFSRSFRDPPQGLDYWVIDGITVDSKNLIFSVDQKSVLKKSFDFQKSIEMGGRHFTVLWSYSQSFIHQGNRTACWITFGGVIFSILITSLILGFQNIFKRAEELAQDMTLKLKESEEKIKIINKDLEQTVRERTSELKVILDELIESEESFRELADSMPQIVWISTSVGENEFMNKRWYEFSGFSTQQNDQVRIAQITHPDDRDRIQKIWEKSVSAKATFETQLRLWDYRQRLYRWFLTRSVPIFDEEGEVKKWVGTSTDIHQQKLLEIEQEKLSALVANSPDSILLFARNGEIVYSNHSADFMLGVTLNTRHLIQEIFLEPTFYVDELLPLLESDGYWNGEIALRNVTEDHEVITYSYIFQIQDKISDSPSLTAFVVKDISDLKSAELERSDFRAREQAAVEASRLKSEFLANMSHEIRTPISGILGLTEILRKTSLNPEQKELLKTLDNSGRTLLELINDILDISKIEAGKIDLESIDFDLYELIESVRRHFLPIAAEKKIDINLDIEGRFPRIVNGDPLRLKQVLMNLLSNALKFSERGEVRITTYLISESDNSYHLHFSIKDEGIGISPENQIRLFTPFTQADSSTTRKYGGTGLGLSISHHLIEEMKGQIGVKSELGKGSVFWFKVALKTPTGTQVPEEKNEIFTLSGLRFLVAEDNLVNQKIIAYTLQELGAAVNMVENGISAIESLKQTNFDIILMDCQMPLMDGYEATRRIRQGEAGLKAKRIPIVAITANALKGDREKCLDSGMSDFLAKPIVALDIYKIVRTWIPDFDLKPDPNRGINHDEEMLIGLKDIFRETAPDSLNKIRMALEELDVEKLEFELHKFRSSLMALNLPGCAQICRNMEEELPKKDFTSLEASFARLDDLVKNGMENF